jgi:hypothetical protein
MTMIDDCLRTALVTITKGLDEFEMAAVQCELRDNYKHCTHKDYPNIENVLGVFQCLPCLYAWCPRAHSK